jgi:hypothetical protein
MRLSWRGWSLQLQLNTVKGEIVRRIQIKVRGRVLLDESPVVDAIHDRYDLLSYDSTGIESFAVVNATRYILNSRRHAFRYKPERKPRKLSWPFMAANK